MTSRAKGSGQSSNPCSSTKDSGHLTQRPSMRSSTHSSAYEPRTSWSGSSATYPSWRSGSRVGSPSKKSTGTAGSCLQRWNDPDPIQNTEAMTPWVRVVSVDPIAEASLVTVIESQRQQSIEPPAEAGWIEVGWRFNGQEASVAPEPVVLAPASCVSFGDASVGRNRTARRDRAARSRRRDRQSR